jgi:hypothetical protein
MALPRYDGTPDNQFWGYIYCIVFPIQATGVQYLQGYRKERCIQLTQQKK